MQISEKTNKEKEQFFREWVQIESRGPISYFATKATNKLTFTSESCWLLLFKDNQYRIAILPMKNCDGSLSSAIDQVQNGKGIQFSFKDIDAVSDNKHMLRIFRSIDTDFCLNLNYVQKAKVWRCLIEKILNQDQYNSLIASSLNKEIIEFPASLDDIIQHPEIDKFLKDEDSRYPSEEKEEVLLKLTQLRDSKINLTKHIIGKCRPLSKYSLSIKSMEVPVQIKEEQRDSHSLFVKIFKKSQLNDSSSTLSEPVNNYILEIRELKDELKALQKLLVDTKIDNLNKQTQLLLQLDGKNKQIKRLTDKISEFQQSKHSMGENCSIESSLKEQLRNKIKENEDLTQEKRIIEAQSWEFKRQISSLSQRMLELQKQKNKELEAQNAEMKKITYEKMLLQDQIEKISQSLISHKLEQLPKEETHVITKQVQDLQTKLQVTQKQKVRYEMENYYHLFEGEVLQGINQEKEFLKQQIEQYTGNRILFTNLIYRFGGRFSTAFHDFIDNHRHICLLIKLKNDRVVSGYSVAPIIKGVASLEGGLILSLTEKRAFKTIKNKVSVSYDSMYLIFGNSELRLRQGEKKLFSNFGQSSGFYNAGGDKYTVLLGEGSGREQQISAYQVFEVIFR